MGSDRDWLVYIFRCADGSLYCGITNDLQKRLTAHNLGKGAKYTRSRLPVELVETSGLMTRSEMAKLEFRIKKTSTDKKLTLLKN